MRGLGSLLRFIPLIVLLFIFTAGLFFDRGFLPKNGFCLFFDIFHFDCPGCGLTRAFLLIPRGDFSQAFRFNAASLPLYLLFVMMFFYSLFRNFSYDLNRVRLWRLTSLSLSSVTLVFLLGHWILKMVSFFSEKNFGEYLQTVGLFSL